MTKVNCMNDDCLFWKLNEGCSAEEITVTFDEGCESFIKFNEHVDYQNEYWITQKDKNTGKVYRKQKKGKRIEIDGIVLFTSENTEQGFFWCYFTEEKTGLGIPGKYIHEAMENGGHFPENTKQVIDNHISEYKRVMDYPILTPELEEEIMH